MQVAAVRVWGAGFIDRPPLRMALRPPPPYLSHHKPPGVSADGASPTGELRRRIERVPWNLNRVIPA